MAAEPSRIETVLEAARRELARVGPEQAAREQAAGALLVDIRPAAQRNEFGTIPGALHIERNVLEWRLDPTSPDRIEAVAAGPRVIVVCQEGYASSLAAASLQALGLPDATDLDGGFAAWAAAGLPVEG